MYLCSFSDYSKSALLGCSSVQASEVLYPKDAWLGGVMFPSVSSTSGLWLLRVLLLQGSITVASSCGSIIRHTCLWFKCLSSTKCNYLRKKASPESIFWCKDIPLCCLILFFLIVRESEREAVEKSFYKCRLWSQPVWMTTNITAYYLRQTWSNYLIPLWLSLLIHVIDIII